MPELDHEKRRIGIGGSDAPAALGLSPWVSQYALWLEKTGRISSPVPDSLRLRAGSFNEAFVRSEYMRKTGIEVLPGADSAEHQVHGFMRANTDGTLPDGRVWEAKTVESEAFRRWNGKVPLYYQIQCAHYCAVLDAPGAVLCALIGFSELRIWELPRNDAFIEKKLIPDEARFWDCVVNKTPPKTQGTAAEIAAMQSAFGTEPEPEVEPVDLDEVALDLALKYQELGEVASVTKKHRDEIKAALFASLLDSPRGYFPNGDQLVRKRHGKGWRLDYVELQ